MKTEIIKQLAERMTKAHFMEQLPKSKEMEQVYSACKLHNLSPITVLNYVNENNLVAKAEKQMKEIEGGQSPYSAKSLSEFDNEWKTKTGLNPADPGSSQAQYLMDLNSHVKSVTNFNYHG